MRLPKYEEMVEYLAGYDDQMTGFLKILDKSFHAIEYLLTSKDKGVSAMAYDIAALVSENEKLKAQVTALQSANNYEIEWRRRLIRAAEYCLDNIIGFDGMKDHLRVAMKRPEKKESEDEKAGPQE